jgi:hypothetical protein
MNSKLLFSVAIGAATLGMASVANAGVIVVDPQAGTVFSAAQATSNSFQVGDKIFDNFLIPAPLVSGKTVVAPLQLIFGQANNGDYTVVFNLGISAYSVGIVDQLIRFSVAVNKQIAPTNKIEDVGLGFNASSVGAANATVDENVSKNDFLPTGVLLGTLHQDTLFGNNAGDHITFEPQDKIYIEKDIHVSAAPGTDGQQFFATISVVDQSFSQVPEPASLGVIALGASGLLLRRRKTA